MKRITLKSKVGFGTTEPVTLPMPQLYNYTEINLSFKTVKTSDSSIKYFDNGSSYDFITTSSKYLLNRSEMINFKGFFEDQQMSRSDNFQFILEENCGFYPFGPDLGDSGIFGVQFIDSKWTTRLNKPWDMYELDLDLHLYSIPYYEVPQVSYKQGSFKLDNLVNLPNPEILLTYENHYIKDTTLGGKLTSIDLGLSNWMYSSKFTFNVSVQNAKLLLNKLKMLRTNSFIIQTPNKCYPFGAELGFGSFVVSLLSNNIIVTNNGHNNYKIEFQVVLQNVL